MRVLCLSFILLQISAFAAAADFVIAADEQAVLDHTNKEREKAGLKLFAPNAKLFQAAREHSKNMARQQILAHELDGKQAWDRVGKTGYKFNAVAENVAFNQKSPKAAVMSWMASTGHRENILNKNYTEIGIGIVKDDNGEPYYTQVFARPAKKNAPEPTGVETPVAIPENTSDSETLADLKQQIEELKREANVPHPETIEIKKPTSESVPEFMSATFTVHNQSGKTAVVTLPSGSTSNLINGARGTYKITAVGATPTFSIAVGKQSQRLAIKDGSAYKLELEDGQLNVWAKVGSEPTGE
jgi:hypothetical protein